jgi:hypothetical protein
LKIGLIISSPLSTLKRGHRAPPQFVCLPEVASGCPGGGKRIEANEFTDRFRLGLRDFLRRLSQQDSRLPTTKLQPATAQD